MRGRFQRVYGIGFGVGHGVRYGVGCGIDRVRHRVRRRVRRRLPRRVRRQVQRKIRCRIRRVGARPPRRPQRGVSPPCSDTLSASPRSISPLGRLGAVGQGFPDSLSEGPVHRIPTRPPEPRGAAHHPASFESIQTEAIRERPRHFEAEFFFIEKLIGKLPV